MGSSVDTRKIRPIPAYFCSVTLQDLHCFGPSQQLDLMHEGRPAKWTVLLGDNGVGKTTVLQCLYALAPDVHTEDGVVSPTPRGMNLPRVPGARHRDRRGRMSAQLDFRPGLGADHNADVREAELQVLDDLGHSATSSFPTPAHPVLCCGYGATRRLGTGSLERRGVFKAGDSLFTADTPLLNAVEWLLQADYAARSSGSARAIARRDTIKDALIALLPDVEEIREAGLSEDPPRPRVEVRTPYGWVNLRNLSLGYRTMIAWVVDVAARMFEAYPDLDNPMHGAAIVLVDEIDLHLHPRWQRKITSFLDGLFPNVQFVATALSPLVMQSQSVANVAVLRRKGDHVQIINDPQQVQGWRVDQILTSDLFGLRSARPAAVEALFDRQRQLVMLDAPTDQESAELCALDKKLATLASGDTARDREAWSLIHELATAARDTRGRSS